MSATQSPVDELPIIVRKVWPALPHAPRAARKLIEESLASVGLIDHPVVEDLQLAVTEAISNVVEHAYSAQDNENDSTVELTLQIEPDLVSVVIVDRGKWRDPPSQPGLRGRGLTLMRALVDFFEVHNDGTGTKVVLRHPLPAT